MYEPPVKITCSPMDAKIAGEVLEFLTRVDIDINEEELIKAIKYDRQQYEKGYRDGIKEFAERLKERKHECGCNYRKKPVYAVTEDCIDKVLAEMTEE